MDSPALHRIPSAVAQDLATRFAARAFELGLAVTRPDGTRVPIPPVIDPVVLPSRWMEQESQRVERLVELVRRAAAHDLAGSRRSTVLDSLSPGLEREAVERLGPPEVLATVRGDLFLGPTGPRVLEVNTTIPAMQGYGDMVARAFIETLGRHQGVSADAIERLIRENGENTLALLRALRAFHARSNAAPLQRLAIVHRTMDSQLTELKYLARRWRSEGLEVTVATADRLRRTGSSIEVEGHPVDLVYRHIFARRIEPEWDLAGILREPGWSITNAVSAPLEIKSSLATLSQAASDPVLAQELALTDADLELVRTRVPWTRRLERGPTTDARGEAITELLAEVSSRPDLYVLKRSWDYGGKAVFLGFERDEPATAERITQAFGERMDWTALVAKCSQDPRGGGFVVQERVVTHTQPMTLCSEDGAKQADLFTDLSVFATLGMKVDGWGGVVRASRSAVVNIASGGGVAPLLSAEVAAKVLIKHDLG